jgi:tRNA 2-thiouridine synthesizing protein A
MSHTPPPNEYSDSAVACDIDARGLACPLPLLKAKLGLNRLQIGQCLRVHATDAGSVRDFHAFAAISGHRLVHFKQAEGEYEYILQKTAGTHP